MTWKEVKEFIEQHGVKDDDEISWIDFVGNQLAYARLTPSGWEVGG